MISVLCAMGLLAAWSCVHEIPEGGDENASVEVTLDLNLNQAVTQHQTVEYGTKAASSATARYLVRFFPYVGENHLTVTPYEFSFSADALSSRSLKMEVPPFNYHIEVWADWTDGDKPYYNADNFGAISAVTDPYTGGSEFRDALCGSIDADLTVYKENQSSHKADIVLHRPNARYEFIATDKDKFFTRVSAIRATKAGGAAEDQSSIFLSDFTVEIIYSQFLPYTYNLHTGLVIDSASGVKFQTSMTELEDGTVNIGWDWVMAKDEESVVVVSIAFYDKDGSFISSLDDIMVPLCPGKKTTVKGNLLTSNMGGGLSIDPSFDGEIVVPIN